MTARILNNPNFGARYSFRRWIPPNLFLRYRRQRNARARLRAQGHRGIGPALDQGTPQKFEFLKAHGIALFPQDGSGIESANQIVVISAAVEDTVPDVVTARRIGAPIVTRAELLAHLFNAAPMQVGVAGTSGKSTTTGMIGWILDSADRRPTVMNGAVMKNFMTPSVPFASAVVGEGDIFVSEVDESDGSIALYQPRVAVVTNIALDHKSLDDLRVLFADFVAKSHTAVLNLDNAETAGLAARQPQDRLLSFSLTNPAAHLLGMKLNPLPEGIAFEVCERESGARAALELRVPGRHNVQNALAALATARVCGVSLEDATQSLAKFSGLRRRFEIVGAVHGVTVIDDS